MGDELAYCRRRRLRDTCHQAQHPSRIAAMRKLADGGRPTRRSCAAAAGCPTENCPAGLSVTGRPTTDWASWRELHHRACYVAVVSTGAVTAAYCKASARQGRRDTGTGGT